MSRQARITTITEAAAAAFLAQAKPRDHLSCKNLPGFHLLKLAKSATWRWRYTDRTGKRRVATVGKFSHYKPAQAAAKVHEWITAGADPLTDKSELRSRALSEVEHTKSRILKNYLDGLYSRHMARWKPRQAKENYDRITGHFGFLLDRDMATITKHDLHAWQDRLEQAGRKHSSIHRIYSSIKALLRQAVKDDIIEVDPLASFSLAAPTLEDQRTMLDDPKKSERRMLTPDEVNCLLTGLERFAKEIREQRRNSRKHGKPDLADLDAVCFAHWFEPFCLLGMHTGLRPGDLRSISWTELNVRFGRLVKVAEKSKSALRRGRKPVVIEMDLNPDIQASMRGWWEQCGRPETGLVFPSARTGGELDKKAHVKPWNRIKRLGGLGSGLNFYSLRHHFISTLLAEGRPIFEVARMAGHRSVEMIERHYGHLCQERAREAANVVAATLRKVKSKKN